MCSRPDLSSTSSRVCGRVHELWTDCWHLGERWAAVAAGSRRAASEPSHRVQLQAPIHARALLLGIGAAGLVALGVYSSLCPAHAGHMTGVQCLLFLSLYKDSLLRGVCLLLVSLYTFVQFWWLCFCTHVLRILLMLAFLFSICNILLLYHE